MVQKVVDYKCKRSDTAGISEKIITDLKLEFPKSYNNASIMAEISLAIKKEEGNRVCLLPFCHTVEAEALGGMINLSEGKFGPRVATYAYNSEEELLQLQEIDFSQGRIGEVLKACQILKAHGEKVVLEVSGFFTILNSLIDVTKIFKAWRKDARTVEKIFNFLANNLYLFFKEAKKAGVAIVSYADPAGSVNIIGPKYTELVARDFTVPFLKKAAALADNNFMIHLCPKTSLILLSLELTARKTLDLDRRINYVEACLMAIGREKIIGQACIKDARTVLNHGKIIALQFV
ncbi:methylcobalamin:coenzyme M methyltransferase [Sporotomaculum syntrophicum]|uniref:Methylcobalamin:coenzyme M methyltransferase n=1 Tax=Sporotomaculum syntrophicum TaxID=182264 RepID=A0A9D2WSS4_9FIRM|nr:uroporphyrinogen decarboxylase family protein [Sporotomaculum syntrophicum]KAF1086704.1 methylcobalamin:coenzyme M methyltransferase [Sporotomaculum syntrophicum]